MHNGKICLNIHYYSSIRFGDRTRNSAEEVGVAGTHTSSTTRRHSKSSYRMEPSGNQTSGQTPNNMAQNNPWRDQTSRQNMEWNQSTRQKPCQMAQLCEGPMFPWGMTGNYYLLLLSASMSSATIIIIIRVTHECGRKYFLHQPWCFFCIICKEIMNLVVISSAFLNWRSPCQKEYVNQCFVDVVGAMNDLVTRNFETFCRNLNVSCSRFMTLFC